MRKKIAEQKIKTAKLTELSLMTTIALVIFMVELRLPGLAPIQGIKMGLANIVTVYAVYHYRFQETAMVVFARIFLGAMFSGRLTALAYSMSGGVLCLLGMMALRYIIPEKYIWLSSVFGAVLHNLGQISMAVVITGSMAAVLYLPLLMATGCMAGLFTGLCAGMLMKRNVFLPPGRNS